MVFLCGLICVIFDLENALKTKLGVVIAYVLLIGLGACMGITAWRINDVKAREKSIPEAPFHELIKRHIQLISAMLQLKPFYFMRNDPGKS